MATVQTITKDELMAALDREARERLGMSGERFLTRYRAGALDTDSPSVSQVAVLARLITKPS